MNPLAAVALGTLGYFVFVRPALEKRSASAAPGTQPTGKAEIVFGAQCQWSIPDAWWGDVAQPKLKSIVDKALAGKPSWEEKRTVFMEQGGPLNSHKVAHQILTGETPPDRCPLPPASANITEVDPMATPEQIRMLNLFAHVIQHVEGAFDGFIASEGTVLEIGPMEA